MRIRIRNIGSLAFMPEPESGRERVKKKAIEREIGGMRGINCFALFLIPRGLGDLFSLLLFLAGTMFTLCTTSHHNASLISRPHSPSIHPKPFWCPPVAPHKIPAIMRFCGIASALSETNKNLDKRQSEDNLM